MNKFIELNIRNKKKNLQNRSIQIIEPERLGNVNVYGEINLCFLQRKPFPLSSINFLSDNNDIHVYSMENLVYDSYYKDHKPMNLDIQVILNGYSIKPLYRLFNNKILISLYKMAKGRRT